MELDRHQKAAVEATESRILVLAGAGSGKTRVLTERVAYLIERQKVSPSEIMSFTFTRKAATEMSRRLEDRISSQRFGVTMGTMHGIALGQIRRFGDTIGLKPSAVTVYGSWEEDFLIKEIAKEIGLHTGRGWRGIKKRDIDSAFNDYYQRGWWPEETNPAKNLFKTFMARCRENNALTYGGLLIGLERLIPTMAKYLKIKHILVDEVQDIDPLQWQIINSMVKAFGADLFVVGDIDQSIYSFRGAVPEYLVDRQEDFKIFRLEANYRSTVDIVRRANSLISFNKNRIPKVMTGGRAKGNEDSVITSYDIDSEELSENLGQMVLLTMGPAPQDIAVLARNHVLLKKLSGILDSKGVKNIYIGRKSELTRSEPFRRVHALLKLIVNPYDNFAFMLTKEILGIGNNEYKKIRFKAIQDGTSHFQAWEGCLGPFFKNDNLIDAIHTISPMDLPFPKDDILDFAIAWADENLKTDIKTYLDWLSTFDLQDEISDTPEGIQLMTVHAAKGLEFPIVIVAGFNEGLMPSKQAIARNDLEDERRVAYVAITRAIDQLILTVRPEVVETENKTYNNPASRFLGEMGL